MVINKELPLPNFKTTYKAKVNIYLVKIRKVRLNRIHKYKLLCELST